MLISTTGLRPDCEDTTLKLTIEAVVKMKMLK